MNKSDPIDTDTQNIIYENIINKNEEDPNNSNDIKSDPYNNNNVSCDNNNNGDDNDSPWNYKILLLLRKVGKKTMGYRWMHEQELLYYDKVHTRFGIIEMLILAFLGTITGGGFINFIVGASLNNKAVYIAITTIQLVTVFVAAVVKGYRNVKKYEKKMNDHFNAGLKNAELNLNIQYQLSLNIKDRENDKIFLKNVIRSFNDILLLSPYISEDTKARYLKESNDNDIFNPIITEGDGLHIVINYDNNNNNYNSSIKRNTRINNNNIDSQINYQIDRWLQHF